MNQNVCLCGCGQIVKRNNDRYLLGHAPKQNGIPPLCACGCNLPVKFSRVTRKWNKYIKYHMANDINYINIYRQLWQTPEFRQKMTLTYDLDQNDIKKLYWEVGLSAREIGKKYDLSERVIEYFMKKNNIPKRTCSEAAKKVWENPDKDRHPKKYIYKPDVKLRHSQAISRISKERWQNPEMRKRMCEAISNKLKQRWQNPDWIAKFFISITRKPNNPESLLSILTPENVEYIGNGSWWRTLKLETSDGIVIKHKNPDFKVKGQKKLIEFNGTYWHRNDYPNEVYQKAWAKIGYEVLIIWEQELKEIDKVLQKIADFIGEQQWQMQLAL